MVAEKYSAVVQDPAGKSLSGWSGVDKMGLNGKPAEIKE